MREAPFALMLGRVHDEICAMEKIVTVFLLYVMTLVIFLALDVIGLKYLIKPAFERSISSWLLDKPRIGAAVVFYAFYVACLIWFVGYPALEAERSLLWTFGSAALLGALAYGTYEFTNLATLKNWTWTMVAIDLVWGTVLTGTSATLGILAVRSIAG